MVKCPRSSFPISCLEGKGLVQVLWRLSRGGNLAREGTNWFPAHRLSALPSSEKSLQKGADAQHCGVLLKAPPFQQAPDSEFQGSHLRQPLSLFSGIGFFLSFCPIGLGLSSHGTARFQVQLVHLRPSSPLPYVLLQYLLLSSLSL